jgi:hypothetical protein
VERNHGTHQDRLVKKLRRKGLGSYAAANEYLEKEYVPEHNRRFAQAAAQPEDYHRAAPRPGKLRQIFRLERERRISNDWVVRDEGRWLQLKPLHRQYGPTQARRRNAGGVLSWGTLSVHPVAPAQIDRAKKPVGRPSPTLVPARHSETGEGPSLAKRLSRDEAAGVDDSRAAAPRGCSRRVRRRFHSKFMHPYRSRELELDRGNGGKGRKKNADDLHV